MDRARHFSVVGSHRTRSNDQKQANTEQTSPMASSTSLHNHVQTTPIKDKSNSYLPDIVVLCFK